MDKKDKKDEIILQQLEVIQTLTEHNLRRMGTDFSVSYTHLTLPTILLV